VETEAGVIATVDGFSCHVEHRVLVTCSLALFADIGNGSRMGFGPAFIGWELNALQVRCSHQVC
jgi:hypothetical protein